MADLGTVPPMPPASDPELIAASTHADKVRVLAFNRPGKRNALSQALIDKFLSELAIASRDARIGAIVVTGGKSFFSGPWFEYLKLRPNAQHSNKLKRVPISRRSQPWTPRLQ
jgi:1,4-dihydroxy-2-naphthoyl-CoA synthase